MKVQTLFAGTMFFLGGLFAHMSAENAYWHQVNDAEITAALAMIAVALGLGILSEDTYQ